MASAQQQIIRKAWLECRAGCLPALAEAKLWAAREVWRAEKKGEHGLQTFASKLVTKFGTLINQSKGEARVKL